jgi:hypothetical protein
VEKPPGLRLFQATVEIRFLVSTVAAFSIGPLWHGYSS